MMPGIDRISELPECLITQILSYLPTRQSVRTSALSKTWEKLYLSVPGLDIDCSLFPYDDDEVILRFVDKLLEFSPESSLLKVRVRSRGSIIDGFMDRLGAMIDRGTQHLEVKNSTCYMDDHILRTILPCVEFMPMNLYTSKTLVYLKISSAGLRDTGFVSLPCLRFLHLEEIKWRVHLEKLLSGCRVLEELTLVRNLKDEYALLDEEFTVMRVRSQSLKKFRVPRKHGWECKSEVKCTLEIDAPGLEYMSLGEDQFDSVVVVKKLTSLFFVELDIKFVVEFGEFFDPWDASKIIDFLNGISSVRHMIISDITVRALDLYSKVGMIPKFNNLSRFEAVFLSDMLQLLPAFLECCPNLKHLVLKVFHTREMEEGLEVPRCVSSTLECVEIQEKLELEEGKMKVTSYFLENSAVLKKLILSPTAYDPQNVLESEIWEKVNKLTKRSTGCEIIIRAMKEVVGGRRH